MARALLGLLLLLPVSFAQELAVRSYGTRDGLVHERVNAIAEDGAGYLWCATWEGLSRFDGRSFTNYGPRDGLPTGLVFRMAVDPAGCLWFSPHSHGLARYRGEAGPGQAFQLYPVDARAKEDLVEAILFDERGLWVGTDTGVFRAEDREAPRFEPIWRSAGGDWVPQAALQVAGRYWMVGPGLALALGPDSVETHPGPGATPRDSVQAQPGPDGRVLIATDRGLFLFDATRGGSAEPTWEPVPCEIDAGEIVHATAIDAQGRLLLATVHGLVRLEGERTRRIRAWPTLQDDWLRTIHLDHRGVLWVGANLGGIIRLREPEVATFLGDPGRSRMSVTKILVARDGSLIVSASDRGLLRFDGERLITLPGSEGRPFGNVHTRLLQDSLGRWWLGTEEGVWCVPGPELDLARAEAVPVQDGQGVLGAFFEDRNGRIWMGGTDEGLYALDRGEQAFTRRIGGASFEEKFARDFLRDRRGVLWMATNEALWRLEDAGLERVPLASAASPTAYEPRALLEDSRGYLWVGTRHSGLLYTREPAAERPIFEQVGPAEGLASERVLALAEDRRGRIWIGSGQGLVRYDPRDGSARCFSTADGLAGDIVNCLLLDGAGALWAGCSGGLSRLDPDSEPVRSPPPPCRFLRFVAGGRSIPLDGATLPRQLELAPSERAIEVAFSGIDLENGESLRFQHRLEGLEADWSEPVAETTLHYASLAARDYRLWLRALTHDGVPSAAPAVLAFRLPAPLWRRGWFLGTLAAALAAAIGGALHLRSRRLHALERIRRQIAADLHDEVGSSLAQIAVLAEVATAGDPRTAEGLREVAQLARETRSSMADLVWAIDPTRDSMGDLVQRLRSVTAHLLDAEGIELVLAAPTEQELQATVLGPDRRRHVLLFLKEAIHNVQRHAAATRVEIELALEHGRLRVRVRDDGRGFDPARANAGHGLGTMRQRARELGADLRLDSAPGRGTCVELLVRI